MVSRILTASLACALATTALAQTTPRILTDRETGKQLLKLPKEDDAFGFVVFGDRTGGPVEGIEVLKQAVVDTNLLDPDLVMTVGDLINGYNTTGPWMEQAKEYKDAMSALRMPWFPVAGNHDTYWRGPGRPEGEHDRHYEATFGPLWYAVRHKNCWFVVLYSDEGNPETGEKNFNKADCQRISEKQFAWLDQTLTTAKNAQHVFVFLHHPRWLKGKYGDDWDRVHKRLAANGNVKAVFAGHIHNMRFGGVQDGIEYYTVASVGAHLGMDAPQAGVLHEYHVVTVRPEGIKVAAIPVGGVMDPQEITDEISNDCFAIHRSLRATLESFEPTDTGDAVRADGSVDGLLTLSFENVGTRPIELEIWPVDSAPWSYGPDHQHVIIGRGDRGKTTFAVRRPVSELPFTLPVLEVRCDYLARHGRISLPARTTTVDLPSPKDLGAEPAKYNGVLVLDGKGCLEIASKRIELPDGALTLECWFNGKDFTGRRGLLAKTENSEFGIFCSNGVLDFSVHLNGRYEQATAPKAVAPGGWHHVAGVFDGQQLRLYLDGLLVASKDAKGKRKRNNLPFLIGADVSGKGKPMSNFHGRLDDVRLSKVARYDGETFQPPQQLQADPDTVFLVPCDRDFGPWSPDRSRHRAHPRRVGSAYCTVEKRGQVR